MFPRLSLPFHDGRAMGAPRREGSPGPPMPCRRRRRGRRRRESRLQAAPFTWGRGAWALEGRKEGGSKEGKKEGRREERERESPRWSKAGFQDRNNKKIRNRPANQKLRIRNRPRIRNSASETGAHQQLRIRNQRESETARQKPARIRNCASETSANQKLRVRNLRIRNPRE